MKINYLVATLLVVGLNLELGANWVEAYSWATQTSYVLGNYDMPLQLTNHELYQKLARATGKPESELIILEHKKDPEDFSGKLPEIGLEVLNNDVLVSPDLFFEKEGNTLKREGEDPIKEKSRYVFFFEFEGEATIKRNEARVAASMAEAIAASKIYSRNIIIKKPGDREFIRFVLHSEPGKSITGGNLYAAVKDRTGEAVDDFYLFTGDSVIPNNDSKLEEFDEIVDMVFTERRQSGLPVVNRWASVMSQRNSPDTRILSRSITIKMPGDNEFIGFILHSKPGKQITGEDLYAAVADRTRISAENFYLVDFYDNEIPNNDSKLEKGEGFIKMLLITE